MQIDFSKKFCNFNGDVLKDATSGKELSLRDVVIDALVSMQQGEKLDGQDKLKRYNLATEIYNGKKENLSVEEIVLLKDLIGKFFTTMIVGQAYLMLEGN